MMVDITHRQQEVADLVAEGLSYQEIAVRLHMSDRTARRHVEDIAAKLGDDGTKPYKRVLIWALRRAS
jgi:DNA-binding CsgD family transcriptional regulator